MTKKVLFFVLGWFVFNGHSQFDPGFEPSRTDKLMQDKNFYLFTAIQENRTVKQLLEEDPTLKAIYENRNDRLDRIETTCEMDVQCLVNTHTFSDEEIAKISDRLAQLAKKETSLQELIAKNLRPSGKYGNFKQVPDAELLARAWQLCAKGVNRIFDVYALNGEQRYPKIDSVSYDVDSRYYKGALFMWHDLFLNKKKKKTNLFFQSALDYALALLYLNHRDEPARYEPMEKLENKVAVANINSLDFENYDYASIIIFGNGPQNYRDRLTAMGKLNLQLGVLEFQANKAPVIIVTGGHAHPHRAEFAEAVEMKKELMDRYGIPEQSIIIEPHARHTTTNLRNAVRLMVKYGIPIEKKSLVVTNNFHSGYTENPDFAKRCRDELGYLPGKIGERTSSTTLEFLPNIESLHQNPLDPLDP